MTPEELAAVVAAPLSAAAWEGVAELTPGQLTKILAALATAGQTNHLQTGGSAPVVTYTLADGGSLVASTGTDSAGTVEFTTGTGGGPNAAIVHVAFAAPFAHPPSVVLVADGGGTGGAYELGPTNVNVNGFDIEANVAIVGAVTILLYYVAVGAPN